MAAVAVVARLLVLDRRELAAQAVEVREAAPHR
jgi:hypothetical protein